MLHSNKKDYSRILFVIKFQHSPFKLFKNMNMPLRMLSCALFNCEFLFLCRRKMFRKLQAIVVVFLRKKMVVKVEALILLAETEKMGSDLAD